MPDDHGQRAGFEEPGEPGVPDGFDELDGPDDFDELDDVDDVDDLGYRGGPGGAGRSFPGPGYPPGGYPGPAGWRRGGGERARRGLLLGLTALVAAGAGFGLVTVAVHDAAGAPTAAATPSSGAPAAGGSGALPSLPAGAPLRLEVGGPVTAVSATSITVGRGDRAVTAAVTRATAVTGKVTSIGKVKVGDEVSAVISGTGGRLTATSIQDPASLPSASGQ